MTVGAATAAGIARAEVPGTIVLLGDIPADGVMEAARDEMPAAWRIGRIAPIANDQPGGVGQPVRDDQSEKLAAAYLEADFLRCLTQLQSTSMDVDRLLEHDRREEAARVGTFAGACALGAGDKTRARELVRRMLVRDLEDSDSLRRTTPEFQTLVDEERAVVRKLGRVAVEVKTTPERADVHIDGKLRCRSTPCRVHLTSGEHLVMADQLGRRPRAVGIQLEEDQRVTLALDEAPAEEVRRQLAVGIAAGMDPTGVEVSQAASTAFGARVLLLVWKEQASVHATAYDRAMDRIVAHVAIDAAPESVPAAVRAVLHEEQGIAQPRPLVKQPAFWLTISGVALLTGIIVLIATRPVEVRHDIVFR